LARKIRLHALYNFNISGVTNSSLILPGEEFSSALFTSFVYNWNSTRLFVPNNVFDAAQSNDNDMKMNSTTELEGNISTAAISSTATDVESHHTTSSLKTKKTFLSSMCLSNIDHMHALTLLNAPTEIHISSTAGFDSSKCAQLLRSTTHPEYVTLKSKTSSQQGSKKTTKISFAARKIIKHEEPEEAYVEKKKKRLRKISKPDLLLIQQLASTYDGERDWNHITELFNEKTKRSKLDGTSLEKSQVHNAYYNHSRGYTNHSSIDGHEKNLTTPTSTDIITSTNIVSYVSTDISNSTARETFSASEISNTELEDAGKGQEWSKQEIEILLQFQEISSWRRKVTKVTANGCFTGLNYTEFQKQFNWQARLYKLANPEAKVYRRTSAMIEEKIKRLRRDKIWV
jgi:hypothetical protein